MKILLDEGVPKIIQRRLTKRSISNVEEMGWRGIKNGTLLDVMAAGQFQVRVTADKNLPLQQNLKKRLVSAIIIPAKDVPTVIELLPGIGAAPKLPPGCGRAARISFTRLRVRRTASANLSSWPSPAMCMKYTFGSS